MMIVDLTKYLEEAIQGGIRTAKMAEVAANDAVASAGIDPEALVHAAQAAQAATGAHAIVANMIASILPSPDEGGDCLDCDCDDCNDHDKCPGDDCEGCCGCDSDCPCGGRTIN